MGNGAKLLKMHCVKNYAKFSMQLLLCLAVLLSLAQASLVLLSVANRLKTHCVQKYAKFSVPLLLCLAVLLSLAQASLVLLSLVSLALATLVLLCLVSLAQATLVLLSLALLLTPQRKHSCKIFDFSGKCLVKSAAKRRHSVRSTTSPNA